MNNRPEERLRLWNLFQACDLDRDGLIDVNDIRSLCKRTELSEYTPETIMDLFDMTDDTKIAFEDFVNKKIAHDQLAFSESTSISSDFTNQTTDESLLSDQYEKSIIQFQSNLDLNFSEFDCDPALSEYSTKLDNYCQSLADKISSLHLCPDQNKTIFDSSSGYTTNSSLKSNHFRNQDYLSKRFHGNFEEQIENIDLSSDSKKKVQQMHQEYINCLNDLSRENGNICSQLEHLLKERNFMRSKVHKMQHEFCLKLAEQKEAWNVEKERLQEKIIDLESIVAKLSVNKYDNDLLSNNVWIREEEQDIDIDIEGNKLDSRLDFQCMKDAFETPTIYKSHLFRLSTQLTDKTLALSEIISNLRNSEIGLLVANCRAAVYLTDDDEQDEIMRIFELASRNRKVAEQDAIDFFQTLDKDFLLQYLPLDEYRNLLESEHAILFDNSFQRILINLLAKFKHHLQTLNNLINNVEQIKSTQIDNYECDEYLTKSASNKNHLENYFNQTNIDSVKYNSL